MSLASPYQEHYYIADGITTSFSFGEYFTALASANVKCIIYFEDGTNCVPTFNVDMTTGFITIVTLTKPDGTILTVPPAGSIVRVFRDTPEQQNVTASQLQNYTAKQLERIFDSVVAMIQEVSYSDLHKSIKLTETQRDVSVEQLTEEKDQSILYWDFESRTLKATDYGQDEVVKSDTVDRLVYFQPEGKIYFIPKGSNNPIAIGSASLHNDLGGRNAPDCHPESAITGLTQDLQELRDKDLALDEDVQTALNRSQEAKDTANQAKETAEYAQSIAEDAKDIAEDAKETAEGIEDIAEEAKDIAQDAKDVADEALDKVTQEITDREDADSDLQDQIDSLSGRGRFLALWNCATGLAESNPPESPYPYKAGDYFVVGTVSSADPAVNYKPDGSSYTTGVASTTIETNEVSVNDTYFYDGSVWKLQSNAQKEVSFSALAGSPYDNTNLSNALNAKQDTLTAGANIDITNNVISSTAQESFFRGNFLTWENVPTNVNDYKENYKHEKTPTFGDFMVVADASDYVNPDFSDDPENVAFQRNPNAFTINIIVGNNTISVYYTEIQNNYKTIRELFTSKGYTGIGCEWLKLKYTPSSPGQWYITSTSNYYENNELVSANTDHLLMTTNEPVTSMFYLSRDAGVAPIALFGGWRFSYYGVWGTDGKNGWKPEYQVEDVLPVATDNVAGIMKLYTGLGTHIDGTITQNGIKTQLDAKQDTLTAGTNITIDANNVISSTAQESFFRGNFNEWSDVPTDTSLYQEDIHGNRVPKDTDFIIVEDASQFVPSGSLMHKLVVENLAATEAFTIRITDENGVSQKYYWENYNRVFVAIDDYYSLKYQPGAPGIWYIKTNDGSPIILKGATYQSGEAQLCLTTDPATPFDVGMPPSAGEYTGAWRFAYYGVWSTDGIAGWTPQYKIENTLPIADATTLGIAKLYTTTGNNTDGSMTQSSITSALNNKVDKNAAITGATHTKITYDNKGLVTAGADITLSDVTDITATAAEVNVLDGITASTTELNYVDGVTSSIQTQIDSKPANTNRVNGAPLSNSASVFYGTSDTAAATVQKEVSIPSITTLDTGTIIIVQPTITSTIANSTLKLNDFAAYPMRYNNAAITTSTDSIVWNAAYPSVWVFDGTYWRFVAHGIDTNTTYGYMSVSEGTTGTATSNRVVRADYLKQIIQGTTLTGIDVVTTGTVSATDTITEGIGKLQATKANIADLATVATSGSYNDLSDKPTMPTVNNPTITITQGGVTKGSFTLNQASGDTIALDAGGGGSVVIDNSTITRNADQEIQAVAVIDQNTGIAKTWTGTMAEYDAIVTKDPETEYIITDDIGGSATEIGEITEDINDLKEHTVIDFQEPTAQNNYTWYRKYADGWVEQGGKGTGNNSVILPVEMSDTNYTLIGAITQNDNASLALVFQSKSTTGFYPRTTYKDTAFNYNISWQVSGMAA